MYPLIAHLAREECVSLAMLLLLPIAAARHDRVCKTNQHLIDTNNHHDSCQISLLCNMHLIERFFSLPKRLPVAI
jgi:hypothetical protein